MEFAEPPLDDVAASRGRVKARGRMANVAGATLSTAPRLPLYIISIGVSFIHHPSPFTRKKQRATKRGKKTVKKGVEKKESENRESKKRAKEIEGKRKGKVN